MADETVLNTMTIARIETQLENFISHIIPNDAAWDDFEPIQDALHAADVAIDDFLATAEGVEHELEQSDQALADAQPILDAHERITPHIARIMELQDQISGQDPISNYARKECFTLIYTVTAELAELIGAHTTLNTNLIEV